MRTFAKKVLILAAVSAGTMMVSNAQVVYWNGLGRALVTGSYLDGNVLNADPNALPTPQVKDLKSARKSILLRSQYPKVACSVHSSLRFQERWEQLPSWQPK